MHSNRLITILACKLVKTITGQDEDLTSGLHTIPLLVRSTTLNLGVIRGWVAFSHQ